MIKILLFCFCFLVVAESNAQNSQIKRTNHWFFGDQAGLDFSSGAPMADTNGQLGAWAGSAVMSDTAGNLLMYTEGQNVWNKNHQLMPNGTGLWANGTPTQSALIVPMPLNDSIYYIFTCAGADGMPYGIRYSIVNMNLDGGLGDVTIKNELLFAPSSEQLGGTMHANCVDVWIMGHESGTNLYRAYLLTENGIDTNDVVINDIGNFAKEDTVSGVCWNCTGTGLKFSPDGKKMAASNFWDNLNNSAYLDTLDLFDFDNSTGLISNLIQLPDTSVWLFGFSPDSKKLYVNNVNTNTTTYPGWSDIFQYNLSVSNVPLSKTLVYQAILDYDFSDFQIGPDQKIYCAKPLNDSLGVIEFPNLLGISCNVIENAISLQGQLSGTMLPNFISTYFNQDSLNGCFYSLEISENDLKSDILIFPNPAVNVLNVWIKSENQDQDDGCSIILIDMLGNVVYKQVYETVNVSGNKYIVDTQNLNSGIYILQVEWSDNQKVSQKIIINH